MDYLLKNLNFKKYSLKFNKEKKILNQNLFTTKLKNFYEINNKKSQKVIKIIPNRVPKNLSRNQ